MFTDANSKPNWRSQPSHHWRHQQVTQPDGLMPSYWLKPDLPYPDLLYNFNIGYENYDNYFQGLIINIHDVPDLCMKLKVPPKICSTN